MTPTDAGADALVSQMLAHGMLVSDPHVGKAAVPVSAARRQRSLVEFDLDTRPRTGGCAAVALRRQLPASDSSP